MIIKFQINWSSLFSLFIEFKRPPADRFIVSLFLLTAIICLTDFVEAQDNRPNILFLSSLTIKGGTPWDVTETNLYVLPISTVLPRAAAASMLFTLLLPFVVPAARRF